MACPIFLTPTGQVYGCTIGFSTIEDIRAAVPDVKNNAKCSNPSNLRHYDEYSQYLFPHMKFTCSGVVIGWTVGAAFDSHRHATEEPVIQIWRPYGATAYKLIHSVVFGPQSSVSTLECNVYSKVLDESDQLAVEEGDILGVYQGAIRGNPRSSYTIYLKSTSQTSYMYADEMNIPQQNMQKFTSSGSTIMIEPLVAASEFICMVYYSLKLYFFLSFIIVVQHNDHTSTVASKSPSAMVMSSSDTVPEPTGSVSLAGTSHVLNSVMVTTVGMTPLASSSSTDFLDVTKSSRPLATPSIECPGFMTVSEMILELSSSISVPKGTSSTVMLSSVLSTNGNVMTASIFSTIESPSVSVASSSVVMLSSALVTTTGVMNMATSSIEQQSVMELSPSEAAEQTGSVSMADSSAVVSSALVMTVDVTKSSHISSSIESPGFMTVSELRQSSSLSSAVMLSSVFSTNVNIMTTFTFSTIESPSVNEQSSSVVMLSSALVTTTGVMTMATSSIEQQSVMELSPSEAAGQTGSVSMAGSSAVVSNTLVMTVDVTKSSHPLDISSSIESPGFITVSELRQSSSLSSAVMRSSVFSTNVNMMTTFTFSTIKSPSVNVQSSSIVMLSSTLVTTTGVMTMATSSIEQESVMELSPSEAAEQTGSVSMAGSSAVVSSALVMTADATKNSHILATSSNIERSGFMTVSEVRTSRSLSFTVMLSSVLSTNMNVMTTFTFSTIERSSVVMLSSALVTTTDIMTMATSSIEQQSVMELSPSEAAEQTGSVSMADSSAVVSSALVMTVDVIKSSHPLYISSNIESPGFITVSELRQLSSLSSTVMLSSVLSTNVNVMMTFTFSTIESPSLSLSSSSVVMLSDALVTTTRVMTMATSSIEQQSVMELSPSGAAERTGSVSMAGSSAVVSSALVTTVDEMKSSYPSNIESPGVSQLRQSSSLSMASSSTDMLSSVLEMTMNAMTRSYNNNVVTSSSIKSLSVPSNSVVMLSKDIATTTNMIMKSPMTTSSSSVHLPQSHSETVSKPSGSMDMADSSAEPVVLSSTMEITMDVVTISPAAVSLSGIQTGSSSSSAQKVSIMPVPPTTVLITVSPIGRDTVSFMSGTESLRSSTRVPMVSVSPPQAVQAVEIYIILIAGCAATLLITVSMMAVMFSAFCPGA